MSQLIESIQTWVLLIPTAQEEVKEEAQDFGIGATGGGEDGERYVTFPDDPTRGIFTEGAESQGEGSRVTWSGGALGYRSHLDIENNGDESHYQRLNENDLWFIFLKNILLFL